MSDVERIPTQVEPHDMDITGVVRDAGDLRVVFRFATAFDAAMEHYCYRSGQIVLKAATVEGDFPADWDDDTYLWDGDLARTLTGSQESYMLPLLSPFSPCVMRFHFICGEKVAIMAEEYRIELSPSDAIEWRQVSFNP